MSPFRPSFRATSALFLCVALIHAPTSSFGQAQSKGQAKCIVKMNAAGGKVLVAYTKDTANCIKGGILDSLPGTAQDCLTADLKNAVEKAEAAALNVEENSCADLPDFAYTDSATVNSTAQAESLALVADVFGGVLDTALGAEQARCHASVQKAYGKILKIKLKIFQKCKKTVLKQQVTNVDDLADECLNAVLTDPSFKIQKGINKLIDVIVKYCPLPGPGLDATFPGKCTGAPDHQTLGQCIDTAVEGRFCRAMAQADAFAFNCDLFDDGIDNGSSDDIGNTCDDEERNGDETGVDCGGACLAGCPNGSLCVVSSDCVSLVCTGLSCAAPNCVDGVLNGLETDLDCGGPACVGCPAGSDCNDANDCAGDACSGGVCHTLTCTTGVLDGQETDVDCGGPDCPGCAVGENCSIGADCGSGVCTGGTCQAPTCSDGIQNGSETDVDCGSGCPVCTLGEGCNVAGDCDSSSCVGSVCTCGNRSFTFNITSNSGGVFDSAEWPGGTANQSSSPGCSITAKIPGDNIDLVCTLGGGGFAVNSFSGFSSCSGVGGDNGCFADSCPPAGSASCCSGRPSCSAALNGSGSAHYNVQCLD